MVGGEEVGEGEGRDGSRVKGGGGCIDLLEVWVWR